MTSFKDFLRWYKNKDVVPILEAMQKNCLLLRQTYRYVEVKRGCTLPNLVNNSLHKYTDEKLYPFTEENNDLPAKIRDNVVGGR